MKKLLLIVLLLLSACTPKVEPSNRKTIEELQVLLKDYTVDAWAQEVSTAYSLFPIAFADSSNDSKGDLQGVISKLDYLNDNDPLTDTDLGIDAVWFNPIFPSDTYHKYDVKDYKAIDPNFGTLDDFKALVAGMHERGIKIVLDMVFNHTALNHPWFQQGIAGKEPFEKYYMIFSKRDATQYTKSSAWYGVNSKIYYGGFWSGMPDLNADNDAVRDELKSVLDFWMDLGVDGFRFDAAPWVYSIDEYPIGTRILQLNQQFWMEMKEYVKSKGKNTYLVGEVWLMASQAANYASSFDSVFNFDLAAGLVNAVNNGSSTNLLSAYLNGIKIFEQKTDHYLDAIFLSNHDQNRVMSVLMGDINKAKLAANILFTLPGTPYVYYGEELGMQGMKPDENIREPFVWTTGTNPPMADWVSTKYNKDTPTYEQQVNDPNSMFTTYRTLIALRKNSDVLRFGDIQSLDILSYKLIGFSRSYNGKTWIILHNIALRDEQVYTLASPATIIHQNRTVTIDNLTVTLGPQSSIILEVN
jgi:alpha-amylase